jgi:hypothetical protein
MKSFKKNPKKTALYFIGKNLSRAPYGTPDWCRTSGNPTSDWLIKNSGNNRSGELENYDFRARYIKREYM